MSGGGHWAEQALQTPGEAGGGCGGGEAALGGQSHGQGETQKSIAYFKDKKTRYTVFCSVRY